MGTALWITLLSLPALFTFSLAINADIMGDSPAVVMVGSNLTLHCVIDLNGTSFTAADVIWIKGYSDLADEHHHTILNDSVAQLHIIDAEFGDKGSYFCKFPGDGYFDFMNSVMSVHVGYPPEPVRNLRCFSTNILDYTCEWDDGRQTNLRTIDTMIYEGYSSYGEGRPERTCLPKGEENFCHVAQGVNTKIRVVSSNVLGNATALLGGETYEFDPNTAVRPNAPENVVANVSQRRRIDVSWQRPEDWTSTSHGLHFMLEYRTEDSGWGTISSASIKAQTSYSLTSLEPYTQYFVRVSGAYDVLAENPEYYQLGNVFGAWSEEVAAFTQAEEPSALIRNLRVLSESDDNNNPDYKRAVTLRWEAVPESEYRGGDFRYNVTVHFENSTVVQEKITRNTLEHFDDIDKFERFTIRVTPYNEVGPGGNIGTSVLTDKTRSARQPENVAVTEIGSNMMRVEWDPPSEVTGYILGYSVQWHKKELSARGVSDLPSSARSYEITGLEANTEYQIKVQAHNKLGPSVWSFLVRETEDSTPSGAPESLHLAPVLEAPDRLELTWERVLVDQRMGQIILYTISFCPVRDSDGQGDGPIDQSTLIDAVCINGSLLSRNVEGDPPPRTLMLTDLKPYTDYAVWITASTNAGPGPASSVQRGQTSQGAPSKPRNLLKTFSNASVVQLSWEAPEHLNGVLKQYEVKYNSESQAFASESATLEVNGYTNYSMRVRACSHGVESSSCGPFSEVVNLMSDIGAPLAVQEIQLKPETFETIHVAWGRPLIPNGPISYYMIRYRPADSGDDDLWQEQRSLEAPSVVTVDCGLVDGAADFDFQVFAVNEVDGVPQPGVMSHAHPYEMCNQHQVPVVTIALCVLFTGVLLLVVFGALLYIKQSNFFKPAPDPYFIEAVLDHSDDKFQMKGRLLSMQSEGEKFDTLRQANSTTNLLLPPYDRLSSKESTSTSSSTDQGIHDMDGFTDEMRYVRETAGSRTQSESDEEKPPPPLPPAKHMMRIMSDDYEEEEEVFGAGCDGSVTYSRIAEAEGADCSTPMLAKEAAQYTSDGSEGYSQLSQVPPQHMSSATPPVQVRGLADQRSDGDSFGSQYTVNYHRLGMSGLTPITSVETLPSEDPLAYSRLSQGSEVDIEYSQLAAASSNPSLTEGSCERIRTEPEKEESSAPAQEGKGVAMSLPSVSAGSRIQPQQEFIVATALAPGNHPQPASQPDVTGYVTGPPAVKPAPPAAKHPSPGATKKNLKGSRKNLADSKSQSGSDSSLTDGEGYSTLGLADSPSSSAPHHQQQPQKAPASPAKPASTTTESSTPLSNGYVPNYITSPPVTSPPPAQCAHHDPPAEMEPTSNGYVTEADVQAISHPMPTSKNRANDGGCHSPACISTPIKHIPNGLPEVGENGYVTSKDMPTLMASPQKTPSKTLANQNAAAPYITPEQMAQIPQGSQSPPSTPPTPLNNNNPLPPGKKLCADDPYVGIGGDLNIAALPSKQPNEFAVC